MCHAHTLQGGGTIPMFLCYYVVLGPKLLTTQKPALGYRDFKEVVHDLPEVGIPSAVSHSPIPGLSCPIPGLSCGAGSGFTPLSSGRAGSKAEAWDLPCAQLDAKR